MKKLIYSSIVLAGVFSLNSCQHEIDTFNNNPNNPTQLASPQTLLSGAEIGTIINFTGNLPRTLSSFTQQTDGVSFQSLDYTNYFLTETDNETDWANIYQTGVNANQIVTQFGSASPYYDGIARILLALNIGYATDVWGDVPFSDAFQGVSGNVNPKYDSQQQVIARIQTYLDTAIADFTTAPTANKSIPGPDDIFYQGDMGKWKRLAYGIKARYAMRLTGKDGSTVAAQNALNYLQNSFTSSGDNLVATFDGGNNQNIWFGFNNQRGGYMVMGKYFIDLLQNNSDPRLPFLAGLNSTGGYSGSSPEAADANASGFGNFFAGTASTPNILFSYSEIKFIEAEARFRLGQTAPAQAALKAAVSASLIDVTGTDNPAFAATASTTVTLQNIITQKYIGCFTTMEPYNDWRRTGFPALTPNQNSQSLKIPLRLITPKSERTLNSNAVVVPSMYTPVWWNS
jgi:hypothetical protein